MITKVRFFCTSDSDQAACLLAHSKRGEINEEEYKQETIICDDCIAHDATNRRTASEIRLLVCNGVLSATEVN